MNSGFRITPARRALIKIFSGKSEPLTAMKIKSILASYGLAVNKTTVYRELSFLLKQNLIQEIYIDPKRTFYESAKLEHHHHFICKKCGDLEDVYLGEELEAAEKKLEEQKKIKIEKHSLEFFGLCVNCQ